MNLFELTLIAGFAAYRLTQMIHEESGPGDIFGIFRTRVGVRYDTYSNAYGTNWFAKGVVCFYCLSVWVGGLIGALMAVAVWLGWTTILSLVLIPFALSGLAVYLKKFAG